MSEMYPRIKRIVIVTVCSEVLVLHRFHRFESLPISTKLLQRNISKYHALYLSNDVTVSTGKDIGWNSIQR